MNCRDCDAPLSRAERHYYGDRCNTCEAAWSERVTAWRKGETVEPELDSYYGSPPKNHPATNEIE